MNYKNFILINQKLNLSVLNKINYEYFFTYLLSYYQVINNIQKTQIFNKKKKKIIENFEIFDSTICNYFFGFWGGCRKFFFRITFKEYAQTLKGAKFSLTLNQLGIKQENFIELINSFLEDTFVLDFFTGLIKVNDIEDYLSLLNFKLHFLVLLKRRRRSTTSTRYYIIFKGVFSFQLRVLLYNYFISDFFYYLFFNDYYSNLLIDKLKFRIGLFLQLIIFYILKFINLTVFKLINFKNFYDKVELLESRGNFFHFYLLRVIFIVNVI